MADPTTLAAVKKLMLISGDYHDEMLSLYIDEVQAYMTDAGVRPAFAEESLGVVAIGVSDLWNYGAGKTELSEYFKQRVIQLALKRVQP